MAYITSQQSTNMTSKQGRSQGGAKGANAPLFQNFTIKNYFDLLLRPGKVNAQFIISVHVRFGLPLTIFIIHYLWLCDQR